MLWKYQIEDYNGNVVREKKEFETPEAAHKAMKECFESEGLTHSTTSPKSGIEIYHTARAFATVRYYYGTVTKY